jgi:LysR family transcriptional regulator, low CO2-responsive transcriptional regulator
MAANYQHLRAFHAIAVEGGVSRAARRLNVSQPTLSQQLKALEARHGVKLFESRRLPLKLTGTGRDLFVLTQRLFAAAGDIDEMLGESDGMAGGIVRLGSDNPAYAARVVELFRRLHPQTGVQVRMGNAREVIRWLSEAQIDAALASDPPADAAFSYEPLFNDYLCCAMPVDHPLARLSAVPVEYLSDQLLLLREPSSKTRAFTERALAVAGVVPLTLEMGSREAIREGIALRLGVSVFFASECPPDIRIQYAPLETPKGDFELLTYLVCQRERKRTVLLRTLHSVVAELRDCEVVAENAVVTG